MKRTLKHNMVAPMQSTLSAALLVAAIAVNADGTNTSLSPYHVLDEIGPDHKTWAIVYADTEQSAAGARRSGRRVVEIATGMHYHDGEKWTASDPSFDVADGAFVADRIRHKVRLDAGLNKIGAVTLTAPDGSTQGGITLRFTPVGIGLYDAASGQSAMIAAITDSSGVLVSSNQVVYENAFNENGVQADVVYTIGQGSFRQDVVFRSRLNVADYGFPTNSTRIQIFTEFYGAPQPDRIVRPIRIETDQQVRSRMASPDLVDEILGFAELAIATGRARSANADLNDGSAAAPIVKQFTNILERAFLIESVEYASIARELNSLPESVNKTASAQPMRGIKKSQRGYASIPSPRSSRQANTAPNRPTTRMAKADSIGRPGVALDFLAELTENITQTKTFQGDTTYIVSAPITCSATVIIEGGAVFKYRSSPTTSIKLSNTLICKASSYRPAIFTALDDNTEGDIAPGSDGVPDGYYANPALHLFYLNGPSLSNLRFKHCQEAVRVEEHFIAGATVSHSQFIHCVKGIVLTGSGGSGTATPLTVTKSLMADVDFPLTVSTAVAANGNILTHCTFADATQLISGNVSSSFTFANSVFASVLALKTPGAPVSLSGSFNGFYPGTNPQFGTSKRLAPALPSPFQSGPRGDYYLNPAQGTYSDPGNLTSFIGAGSSTANLRGLYHYTTSATADSKELGSQVDLGFHYEAVTASNILVDTDGDGLPDVLEDRNGNGLYATGDLADWQLTVTGTGGVWDGGKDFDGDKLSNLADMKFGRDPFVADKYIVPRKLLIYYGYPARINNGSVDNVTFALTQFKEYDYVVLGAGLEMPAHENHIKTEELLAAAPILAPNTMFFGYIALSTRGVDNFSEEDIEERVGRWKGMKVDGIFYDEFGFDYLYNPDPTLHFDAGYARGRQNFAVTKAHALGLPVIANANHEDDAIGEGWPDHDDPPDLTDVLPELAAAGSYVDFYFYEEHQFEEDDPPGTDGDYVSAAEWKLKADRIRQYELGQVNGVANTNFTVMSVTTTRLPYDEDAFHYSWYSAFLYGHEATGWGEPDFSGNSQALYRARPTVLNPGTVFTGPPAWNPPDNTVVTRTTNTGTNTVDTTTHEGDFP